MSATGERPEPRAFRARFPVFERKVFLNSCSKGALATSVEEAYREYLDSWGSEGSPWETWVSLLERVRSRFASFFGCDADELAVTYSASVAAASLASALRFEAGRNRVLLDDFEFPTIAHILLLQERRGAEIVRVRADGGRLPMSAYERALDERALLVPATRVCFRNGHRQDVASLAAKARAAGAYTLVDDYQSSGVLPLDVKAIGCDFLVTGALKYLLGSSGLAFLYVRRELIEELEPTITGWFGQERPFDFDIERVRYHGSARRFETGTPAVPSLYAGLAALALIEEVGIEAVSAHVEGLASMLVAEARERAWRVLTPDEPERRGPLVVLGCRDAGRLVEALAAEGIVVSARGNGLRVSFHYYNIPEDVEALLRALDSNADLMEPAAERR